MLKNRSIPNATVIPELSYPDVLQATDWLCAAFGFTLRISMGSHRAQLNVGESAIAVMELREDKVYHQSLIVRVEDVEKHYAHALQHGVKILRPPVDYPYGERQYTVQDFAGHRWTFSQTIADIAPEDWGGISGQL
jgi:uncharacterized glyoxalase superfamily protein PhnB